MILRYVSRDHAHPLYGRTGTLVARTDMRPRRPLQVGIELASGRRVRNEAVEIDGTVVVAPWGNWRRVRDG